MGEYKLCSKGYGSTAYVKCCILIYKYSRGKLPLLVKLVVIGHIGFGNNA